MLTISLIQFIISILIIVFINCKNAELTVNEKNFLQQNIFQAIAQIRSNNKRLDLKSIYSYLVKIEKLKELSVQYLQ